MEDRLVNLLKKYITIFIEEYGNYLTKDNLETLRNIDYQNVFVFDDFNVPFGTVFLDKIYLSNSNSILIDKLKEMPNYNKLRKPLNNKNLSSYLKYMCDNGYNLIDYYEDILMYFVFKLVIKNSNGLINGLISQEMKYLGIKYGIRFAFLYPREETITNKLTPLLGIEGCRKIIFSDSATAFKYLNDNKGYRVAKLVNDISILIGDEYQKLNNKEYVGYSGFLDYAYDYDHLLYGDVYNYILDFEVENEFTK